MWDWGRQTALEVLPPNWVCLVLVAQAALVKGTQKRSNDTFDFLRYYKLCFYLWSLPRMLCLLYTTHLTARHGTKMCGLKCSQKHSVINVWLIATWYLIKYGMTLARFLRIIWTPHSPVQWRWSKSRVTPHHPRTVTHVLQSLPHFILGSCWEDNNWWMSLCHWVNDGVLVRI